MPRSQDDRLMNKPRQQQLMAASELVEGGLVRCPRANGTAVLLCRVSGEVHALADTCPHEEVSLSLGSLRGHVLRCPLHGSEFDVRSGAVLSEPCEEDLARYPVDVDADGWICMAEPSID